MALHETIRSRREVVRRTLTVETTEYVTPRMLRIVFRSPELAGFDSPSADDHIKIFLPAGEDGTQARRDFTPRAWDAAEGTLTLEFALHESGPAAAWARGAKAGDTLEIGGPKGSNVVPDDFDWYLLVGDACALPSIARRLEGLRAGVPVFVLALVAGPEEEQDLRTQGGRAGAVALWWTGRCERCGDAARGGGAAAARRKATGTCGSRGEATVSRELYRTMVDTRGTTPSGSKRRRTGRAGRRMTRQPQPPGRTIMLVL